MNDRPTPETTNEVNRGVATGETHSGRLLSMTTLARKLERERDELKEKIKILTSPSIEGVLTRMKGNLEIVDRIKTERDEAIREVAELRGQLAVCEEHAGTMAKDFDGIVEPMNLNELSKVVHAANIKWWQDMETGQPIKRNKGELLALIHSEISECLEGERKDLMDDKLPHRKMAEVELADALIRILDYAAGFGYDLQGAFDEKMAFNAQREDHKHEARRIAGGKQF